jgi:hypothetical protein
MGKNNNLKYDYTLGHSFIAGYAFSQVFHRIHFEIIFHVNTYTVGLGTLTGSIWLIFWNRLPKHWYGVGMVISPADPITCLATCAEDSQAIPRRVKLELWDL